MHSFFNCVLANPSPPQLTLQVTFPNLSLQRFGKHHFSASSVLDNPESDFVIVGDNTKIVALLPHGRCFLVDIADPPCRDVRSLEQSASFSGARFSVRAEALSL